MEAVYSISLQDRFTGTLSKIESRMNRFESKMNSLQNTAMKIGSSLGIAFGGAQIIRGIGTLAEKVIKLGSDMEQTRVSFETMLGNADKANDLIKELQKFASATPFRSEEVVSGAKQLLAFGFGAGELTTQLSRLGDVSAGLSIPIGDLIYLYGTLRAQGKAYTKDIMQFAQRGIPIYEALAKVLKVDQKQVGNLVSEGKVGFKEVEKAFINMTAAGSKFGGLMEKQSKTLAGRFSTLQDNIEIFATKLGERAIPTLGIFVEKMIKLVELIPALDIHSITDQLMTLVDAFKLISSTYENAFKLFGGDKDPFTIMQRALQLLGVAARVALTPLRTLLTTVKLIYETVSGLVTALYKLSNQDFSGASKAFTNIGAAYKKALTGEAQGWADIFKYRGVEGADWPNQSRTGPDWVGDFYKKNSGTAGGGGNGNKDGSKEAGIEKVSSGNRNVYLNIGKLIGEVKFEKSLEKSEAQLMDIVKRALLTAVNDVNIVSQ